MTASEFTFAKSEQARRFCLRVRDALREFCDKSDDEATRSVVEFRADRDDIAADDLLYYEPPYDDAMCIAHDHTLTEEYGSRSTDTIDPSDKGVQPAKRIIAHCPFSRD